MCGKWSHDPEEQAERISKAKVVAEAHPDDISFLDHLRHTNPRLDYEVDQ
jgi:hypothetical protein